MWTLGAFVDGLLLLSCLPPYWKGDVERRWFGDHGALVSRRGDRVLRGGCKRAGRTLLASDCSDLGLEFLTWVLSSCSSPGNRSSFCEIVSWKTSKELQKKFNAVSLLPKRRCIAMVYKNGTTPLASSPFKWVSGVGLSSISLWRSRLCTE